MVQLKFNYNRINKLYKEAIEEIKNTNSDHNARVISLNENITRLERENEVLREKEDILLKLSRSYINRFEPSSTSGKREFYAH